MLAILIRFYSLGRLLFAPNQELVEMLRGRTGRPTALMTRGVDTELFHPSKRRVFDSVFRIGFVGRITPEKSVRLLARVEQHLLARGLRDFRFVVVGDGSEREWLRVNLRHVDLPGILRGEELAAAYAGMDIFLFPSRTDTFGNVVQEAMASGVPPIVTDAGGPRFIVRDNVSGFVTYSDEEMLNRTVELMVNRDKCAQMSRAGREQIADASWDRVFDDVYAGYRAAIQQII
jgi:glycosyltransferase involved in cell wall biosynthesis